MKATQKIALRKLLESIEEFLGQNGFPLASELVPGINANKIEPRNFTGLIPDDLKILYQWKNGIKPEFAEDLIGRLTLFPGSIPMAIEKVWWLQDSMGGDPAGWRTTDIPVFESGGGEFYILNCNPEDKEHGRIHYNSPGTVEFENNISIYDSLYSLLQTTYECYKRGIYTAGDKEMLTVDYPAFHKVAHDLNPKSKYWAIFR